MRPEAHASAAITILDLILEGLPINKVLLNWFRSNRFAGSKDRQKIKNLVFDSLRFKSSIHWGFGLRGLPQDGRALVLGILYKKEYNLKEIFNGNLYGPKKITEIESNVLLNMEGSLLNAPDHIKLDFPHFLNTILKESLQEDFEVTLKSLQQRAEVFIRVNALKSDLETAKNKLLKEHIQVEHCKESELALRVVDKANLISKSKAFQEGDIEIQDLTSQLVIDFVKPSPGLKVLDFCAGGGGKTLALASLMSGKGKIFLHDKDHNRMKMARKRMKRAGVSGEIISSNGLGLGNVDADLVLVDAPCSGTGVWRRNPGSKWWLNENRIKNILDSQRKILLDASACVKNGGKLAYITCSILNVENEKQVNWFLKTKKNFYLENEKKFSPLTFSDGFYVAILRKRKSSSL